MKNVQIIKKYLKATNKLVIEMMYLKEDTTTKINKNNLKRSNPGHLGTGLTMNFILANLNFYLNRKKQKNKIIIGAGHAGISVIANQYLSGELVKYYPEYSLDNIGLNKLINDFGLKIRSEINISYPGTIYEGGELGYSLATAYGYAIDLEDTIIPCIIGDGEAETPCTCSAFQLNKMLKTKSKVLPIINLNGLKMGGSTYLSKLCKTELNNYYGSFGYQVHLIDFLDLTLDEAIYQFQKELELIEKDSHPLLIIKIKKGYTLPKYSSIDLEGNVIVHKNPLSNYDEYTKVQLINRYLKQYNSNLKQIPSEFNQFKFDNSLEDSKKIQEINYQNNELPNIKIIEDYLVKLCNKNNLIIFSPDELSSNKLNGLKNHTFELLSEQVLQGLYEGYIQSGANGYYIAYEGFMMLISSMISQHRKLLRQKEQIGNIKIKRSLTYILTSTAFENTYSHQNPDFIDNLLLYDDNYVNVFYPKDGLSTIKCLKYCNKQSDKINIITTSKRHDQKYPNNDKIDIEIIKDIDNPEVILCATGDYMLDEIIKLSQKTTKKVKTIYITNPRVLDINSSIGLDKKAFNEYFDKNAEVIYYYMGNPNIIKSLIYERNSKFNIYGYKDLISIYGSIDNNIKNNIDIEKICKILEIGRWY